MWARIGGSKLVGALSYKINVTRKGHVKIKFVDM
jgi:hypothetical protein